MTKYYVALVEEGIPRFSSAPVAHEGKFAAKDEANRLAALHPGQTFRLYLESSAPPSYVAPKPKEPEYTTEDLKTGKAPAGTYKVTDSSGSARVVVVTAGGIKVALYVNGDIVQPLASYGGSSGRFVRAKKQLTLQAA